VWVLTVLKSEGSCMDARVKCYWQCEKSWIVGSGKMRHTTIDEA
jgi:hypothetical protein